MLKRIIQGIKIVIKDKLYLKIAIFFSLLAADVYYWLITRTVIFPNLYVMAQEGEFGKFSSLYLLTYLGSTFLFIIFFGLSMASSIWLWKHSKFSKLSGASSITGAIVGAFAAGCPVCGAFLLSLIGVAGGLTLFPFQGLELKVLSLLFVLGSLIYSSVKVYDTINCEVCVDTPVSETDITQPKVLSLSRILIYILIILFFTNQYLSTNIAVATGIIKPKKLELGQIFKSKTATSKFILAPKLNSDGKTTSIVEQPTITDVPGNPNTSDKLADAKVVMLATGSPFYAPDNISFDDPIAAQRVWGAFERSITLKGDLNDRYNILVSEMTCGYCCGSANSVTRMKNCGCAHARAARGFLKYMLDKYGDEYSNEVLLGEAHRWYAIWYPRGYMSDYLLATGNESALPHQSHGGAGADGRHGL